MKINQKTINKFNRDFRGRGTFHLIASAAMGMSFILFSPNASEISAFKQDEIRSLSAIEKVITVTSKICVGCDRSLLESEFASKGKQRKSKLCKTCDNERRRLAYKPRSPTPKRDELTISFESSPTTQMKPLAVLIFDLLQDQQLIEVPKKQDKVDVSTLIRKKSVIDFIS